MKITSNLKTLVKDLDSGKIVCFKTDTIWGLSANPLNPVAIKNLYELKSRDLSKPFIFLIKENEDLLEYINSLNEQEKFLIKNYWPGPLTVIFKAKDNLEVLKSYSNKSTIALRMPKDETCQNILNLLNYPLPSTSVNKENEKPLNTFEEVCTFLKDTDTTIFKSNSVETFSQSSTIVDCQNDDINVIREGDIKKSAILNKLKKIITK